MNGKVRIEIKIEVDLDLTDISIEEAIERFGVTDSWYMSDIFCDNYSIQEWKEIKFEDEQTNTEVKESK